MTTTLPVVAHQLVSQSVLESLKKRLGHEMTTTIKKLYWPHWASLISEYLYIMRCRNCTSVWLRQYVISGFFLVFFGDVQYS